MLSKLFKYVPNFPKLKDPLWYVVGKYFGYFYYSIYKRVLDFLDGMRYAYDKILNVHVVASKLESLGISGYYEKAENSWKIDVLDFNLLTLDFLNELFISLEENDRAENLDHVVVSHAPSACGMCDICQTDRVDLEVGIYSIKEEVDDLLTVHSLLRIAR